MINLVDILGIIIVFLCAIFAFRKGFVKTFFGFISTFLAIILAFVFCKFGAQMLKDYTTIDEWLEMTLNESIDSHYNGSVKTSIEKEKTSLLDTLEELPENVQEILDLEEYKQYSKEYLIKISIEAVLKILSWIVIYIVVRLILAVLCFVLGGIMSIPVLKQINNLAGLALGVIMGFFRIYVILAFISFLVPVIPIEGVVGMIKNSLIISVMYENNILISLIF